MAPTKTKYNDHYYRRATQQLREHVEKTGEPCHLCGQPIDLSLPYTHPMSFTADHIECNYCGAVWRRHEIWELADSTAPAPLDAASVAPAC